nr:hypothetical protein [Tanacetum cinerariifolium]
MDKSSIKDPKTTRANPATTTTTTTTSVTDAQLAALIEQGAARALAAHDADRNTNGDDNHNSGIEVYPPLGRDTFDSNQMKWVHLRPQEVHRPLPEGNHCFQMELGLEKS